MPFTTIGFLFLLSLLESSCLSLTDTLILSVNIDYRQIIEYVSGIVLNAKRHISINKSIFHHLAFELTLGLLGGEDGLIRMN